MTDLLDTPTPASTPMPTQPPAPPTPPPGPPLAAPVPQPPVRQRRSGRRFLAGVIAGAAATGLTVGGISLLRDDASTAPAGADAAPTTAPATGTGGATTPGSVHDLVVAVRPSIAAIHTTVVQTDIFGQPLEGAAAGSGFVLSADGYIVTNNHVIDGAESITVTLGDGVEEDARVVAADARSDLAVLHVDRTDLVPLPIGDSDAIQVGDPVVAIGNALDLGAEPTVTGGMVSAKDRTIPEPNGQVLVNLLQTDAAINPGNSGGPLLDLTGHVVGINTAISGQGQNIGFAIAINPAHQLIDQLRNGQVPRHALLGVSTAPTTDGTPGALVMAVEAGSAADQGGLEVGDVVTDLAGDEVTSPGDLVAAIARHQPADTLDVTVVRNGASRTISVTLGAHEDTSS